MGWLYMAGDARAMLCVEGKLLVASPQLQDPNFYRTVVFIVRHDDEGAYGLVLNRPTNQCVETVMEMLLECPCHRRGQIMFGGPVEGPLVVLHDSPSSQDIECGHDLFLASCQDRVRQLMADEKARVLIFDGYSGWGPGQLEDELKVGGWLVAETEVSELFGDSDEIWERALKRIGRDIIASMTGNIPQPPDPTVN